MKVTQLSPPRTFKVGSKKIIELKDCAHIHLEANEQVTFVSESGAEYDVVRKSWGFYATPSLNARLKQFGLRAVLVKSPGARFYVWLVERDREADFQNYLDYEDHSVVAWLDDDSAFEALEQKLQAPSRQVDPAPLRCLCNGADFSLVFTYHAPPEGEIRFQFSSTGPYERQLLRCNLCGHFVSKHTLASGALYSGDYVNANYQDEAGVRRTFERIIALDPSKSDNIGRVRRIVDFAAGHFQADRVPSILDVGSGLGVFPYKIKEAGWDCTALDPDPRAVDHARKVVGVKAVQGDFMEMANLGRFDVITFNKVLEHVEDPVAMLAKSTEHLNPGGFVYVEVPDGEAAIQDSPEREEFFIDHLHVFSLASLALLAARAGFSVRLLERLREPSSKYTLRAFIVAGDKL